MRVMGMRSNTQVSAQEYLSPMHTQINISNIKWHYFTVFLDREFALGPALKIKEKKKTPTTFCQVSAINSETRGWAGRVVLCGVANPARRGGLLDRNIWKELLTLCTRSPQPLLLHRTVLKRCSHSPKHAETCIVYLTAFTNYVSWLE